MHLGFGLGIGRNQNATAAAVGDVSLSFFSGAITMDVADVQISGTYADGTSWVQPSATNVTVSNIIPTSAQITRGDGVETETSVWSHGAMIDPGQSPSGATLTDRQTVNGQNENKQGWDELFNEFYGGTTASSNHLFDTAKNVDPGSTAVDIVMGEGTLVKAASKLTDIATRNRDGQLYGAVLTVVGSAPASDAFRPPACDADKTSQWRVSDMNMTLMPSLSSTGISVPTVASLMPLIIHYQAYQGTYSLFSRPILFANGQAGYDEGAYIAHHHRHVAQAMLGLCMDDWTAQEKIDVATVLVQLGIDVYGRIGEGGIWTGKGGATVMHGLLLAFTGFILEDATLKAAVSQTVLVDRGGFEPAIGASIFGEFEDIVEVTQAIIDETRDYPYTSANINWPEWTERGPIDLSTPSCDNSLLLGGTSSAQAYRDVHAQTVTAGHLAARLMGIKADANIKQLWWDYWDRHTLARIDNGEEFGGASSYPVYQWVIDAWNAHRGTTGLWSDPNAGPDPVLTVATDTADGKTAMTGSVTTDIGSGTLYWVVTQSAVQPTGTQIFNGVDENNDAADYDGSQAVSSTGAQAVVGTGLVASTQYYTHYMHEADAARTQISADGFETDALGGVNLVPVEVRSFDDATGWIDAAAGGVGLSGGVMQMDGTNAANAYAAVVSGYFTPVTAGVAHQFSIDCVRLANPSSDTIRMQLWFYDGPTTSDSQTGNVRIPASTVTPSATGAIAGPFTPPSGTTHVRLLIYGITANCDLDLDDHSVVVI